jgi:site-specific DNA-methyltransferase (adenine-specific)
MDANVLYYGDNLHILRHYIPDESIDLIYLDPPFNSQATYNVLFREESGGGSHAQIEAFEDTWHWSDATAQAYEDVMTGPHQQVARMLRAMVDGLGHNQVTAYLSMMAVRLVELHRTLKDSGSIYLHCDPTASHYLKALMDSIFGPLSFLNEITWKRTHSHGNVGRNFGSICDAILVYTKGRKYTWNQQFSQFPDEYVHSTFKYSDADGRRWQSVTLRNPSPRPNLQFPFTASNGVTYKPHRNGWVCNLQRLERYDREGRLHFPSRTDGALRLKMYLDESEGIRLRTCGMTSS